MDKLLTMSSKELSRLEVMQRLVDKRMSQAEAAEVLDLSIRQLKRLLKAYRREGAKGLVSKRRGRSSNNRLAEETKQNVLDLLKSKYTGFGPTLAQEKLVELDGLRISDECVRQLMIAEGLWKAKKARKVAVHQMRERRAFFGELVQMDGSPHDWFKGRAPACDLLVFMVALSATIIDDATSRLGQLLFVESESFFSYCQAAESYFTRYGKPGAFYRVGLRQRQTQHLPGQSAQRRDWRRPDAVRTGDAGTGYPDHLCQHASSQRPRRAECLPKLPGATCAQRTPSRYATNAPPDLAGTKARRCAWMPPWDCGGSVTRRSGNGIGHGWKINCRHGIAANIHSGRKNTAAAPGLTAVGQ